ncbi:type I restriction endonuclease subunit S [Escherichia coli]|nr:type I restriction endonuclease subunit S [Escherichia coli]EFO2789327.1 type I restriction endonuclease subunit S [Escherichia coli]MDN1905496.1 type I restriction endonuclease subunit S [Escherichia coli]HAW0817403.1 type I restriction endonuclease subunit S [Escherichia coli]
MSAGKLPEGWVNTTIENISVKCSQRVPAENEEFIYVDIGSINRDLKFIETPQYLSGKNAPSRARKVIKAGDVIVSLTRPNLNAVALVDEKYDDQIASTGFEVIHPVQVESKYIFGLVRSRHFIDSISGLVQGALYPAAKSSDVQSYVFPLPPLAEQKIIAEKLDTLLAQVESTKARLEQIPQILKRFRQAILANAVDGKLTDEWRAGKRYITEIKKISDIIQNAQVGLVRSASAQSEICTQKMRTPYIKMNNIHNVLGTNLEKLAYVNCDSYELEKYRLKNGDWLFNTRNSYELVGKSCVWNGCNNAVYNNNILRIRLKENYSSVYLDYWFRSFYGVSILNSIKSATTNVAAIYQKELLSKSVPFPPLPEQHEIVRRVEQLFAYADTIEKQVNNALARVNNLTQSILAKAFRGELTAQWRAENPDLISGENSAAALLEKIKAERAASGGKKASRKKS